MRPTPPSPVTGRSPYKIQSINTLRILGKKKTLHVDETPSNLQACECLDNLMTMKSSSTHLEDHIFFESTVRL